MGFPVNHIRYKQRDPITAEVTVRDWVLGLGPCGKIVTSLVVDIGKHTAGYMQITQHCKKQRKPDRFMIPLSSIVGGIQFLNGE